jgi:hypothetical protein
MPSSINARGAEESWSFRPPFFAQRGAEPAIEDGGPDYGDAMSALRRPSHSLALAHARIGDFVNASLRAGGGYRAFAVVPAMIVDNASPVVLHVTTQLQAVAQQISGRRLLGISSPESDVLRVIREPHQFLIRLRRAAVPQ